MCAYPKSACTPCRKGVRPEDAAAVLHGAATAAIGLCQLVDLKQGQHIFIGGAAGAVGNAALQVSAWLGATAVTTSSETDTGWCQNNGAQIAFDYRSCDLDRKIQEASGSGFHVWWDQSGSGSWERSLQQFSFGGTVLVTAGMRQRTSLTAGDLYLKNRSVRGFAISNATEDSLRDAAKVVNRMLAERKLAAPKVRVFPVSEAAHAYQMVEIGRAHAKIVIVP